MQLPASFLVIKPGDGFIISDVVLVGELPDTVRNDAEVYAGCVSGTTRKQDYLDLISKNSFEQITIQVEKTINVPDDILAKYLSADELKHFRQGQTGIFSITIYAEKPAVACCPPRCC